MSMQIPSTPVATRPTMAAPIGWRWRLLGEVARLESGHTPSRREPAYWDGGDIAWLSLRDIKSLTGKRVLDTFHKPTQDGIDNSSARVLPADTVALCRTASVGKVAILGRAMATSQDFVNWVCGPDVIPDYLYWALIGSGPMFECEKQGSTHKTIYMPTVERFQLLLPPLTEQRRIAAILDEADALRRKRREALGLLDDLLRSAFLEIFGDPVTNPRGWPRRNLRTVISDIKPGWSASGTDRPAASGEWGVLKVSAVSTGLFLPDENKMVESPEFVKPPVVPRRGDLLFSRANTRELVAATCLVDADVERVFLPDKLWRISCFAEIAMVEWLRFLLANDGFRHTLTKQATGTSGSMLNVSQDKLLDLEAPVPPVADQRRFAALVWAAMSERRLVADGVAALDRLFDSLLQRAFAGAI